MRILITAFMAISLMGCCGAGATAQSATAGTRSAMAPQVTHDGCSINGGLQCGGKALFGIEVELPDIGSIIGGAFIPGVSQAAPAPQATDPCAGHWEQVFVPNAR